MQWLMWRATASGLLHAEGSPGSWLVTGLVAMLGIVVFGGLLTVILVCLARKEDRPDTIRAAAEVLAVLLPWPWFRGHPGTAGRRSTGRRGGVDQPR
jgi:hypothetical protein